MKKWTFILFILLLNQKVWSQEIRFDIHGNYERSTTHQKLESAQTLSEICFGYPSNWISDTSYISSEVSTLFKGNSRKATAADHHLSSEQKNLLALAEPETEIMVEVRYRHFNPEARQLQINKISYRLTVIPETEAEFDGGKTQLDQYLKTHVIPPVERICSDGFKRTIVHFTINENGEISDTQLKEESGNAQADQIIMAAIRKMPRWKPAKNGIGKPIRQDFKFTVSGLKEGC